ncbi:hypothetical protein F5Y07DRAFT_375448, partial [Xylaria sp. FL0933]
MISNAATILPCCQCLATILALVGANTGGTHVAACQSLVRERQLSLRGNLNNVAVLIKSPSRISKGDMLGSKATFISKLSRWTLYPSSLQLQVYLPQVSPCLEPFM